MHLYEQIICLHWIFIFLFAGVSATGWKPIVPPADYYATMPTTCISDCGDQKTGARSSDAVVTRGAESEIYVASVWPKPGPVGGTNHRPKTIEPIITRDKKDLIPSGQNVKYVYHPSNVAFYTVPEVEHRKPFGPTIIPYHQEVFKKGPANFYNFKTIVPKPVKTLYYGEPEILKTKISNDVKYLPTNIHHAVDDIKILIQPADETDLKSYRPLAEYHYNEHCSMHKVSFQQNLYYQYVQYKTRMPELKEFTICLWFRLHNHSLDHSLLSYSAKPHHKGIYMWVSNLEDPGLFYMKVLGQTIFRLNYPLKLYKWYHTCQSWNGHTGEWQVWVDGHRIARGFHNLLVGHKIPGKGVVITGQEQRNLGKNFQDTYHYSSKGLQGEITMLQMYKVALTAGKANNDHRHHHSHHTSTTPEPPSEESTEEMPPTTGHPLLENGQLKTHVNILELVETLKTKGHIEGLEHHDHDHDNHNHYGDYDAFPHPLALSYQDSYIHHGDSIKTYPSDYGTGEHGIFKREDRNNSALTHRKKDNGVEVGKQKLSTTEPSASERQARQAKIKVLDNILHPVRVEKVKFPVGNNTFDGSLEDFSESNEEEEDLSSEEEGVSPRGSRGARARRHHSQSSIVYTSRSKPITTVVRTVAKKHRPGPKMIVKKVVDDKKKEPTKRYLLLADPYSNYGSLNVLSHTQYSPTLAAHPQGYDALPQYGQHQDDGDDDNPLNSPVSSEEESHGSPTQHELAENEVKRIMLMCSGCHVDPFRKVAVISWRSTPKKIYSGALLLKAKSECENF